MNTAKKLILLGDSKGRNISPVPVITNKLIVNYATDNPLYMGLNGNNIARFLDLSGNGNHTKAQAAPARQAVLTANQQNSLSSAVVPALGTYELPASLYGIPNAAFSSYIVSRIVSEAGNLQVIIDFSDGGDNNDRSVTFFGSVAGQISMKNTNAGGVNPTATGNTNTISNIIKSQFDGTTGQLVQVNANAAVTNTQGTLVPGINTGWLFSRSNSSFFYTGVFSELIYFAGVLSGGDDTTIKAYLKTKWGTP